MKKIFSAIAVICLSTGILSAQYYLIDKFSLSATGREYGVYAEIDTRNEPVTLTPKIHFDMDSPNDFQEVTTELYFSFSPTVRNEFVELSESLSKTKDYFNKWSKIAKEHDVKLLKIKIPVKFYSRTMNFTQDGKWYSKTAVNMQAFFYVNKKGDCFVVLETDEMTSKEVVAQSTSFSYYSYGWTTLGVGGSSGKVVAEKYCSGASLVFSSEKEIDDFLKALDNVIQWKKQNIENGKLFTK